MPEADLLERRQLVDAGSDDRAAGYQRAVLVPGEEADVERRDRAIEPVRDEAEERPGCEVTGEEHPRRRRRVPCSERPRATREWKSAIGATEGNIIAAIIVTHTPRNQTSPPRSVPGPAVHPVHALVRDNPRDERAPDEQRPDLQRPAARHAAQAKSR